MEVVHMNIFYNIIFLISFFPVFIAKTEKVKYLSVERPNITYINPNFFIFANQSSRRYSRNDPVYYHELHLQTIHPLNNTILVDFYFYEWLTNAYKPTFVEMHFKWCNLVHKDKFFGAAMKQGNLTKPCPHPPGEYHLYNMTVPGAQIPNSFPFTRGRIYCNITHGITKELLGAGSIDMEIKYYNRKI